ncbi:RICIN domain-containing protein [Paraflavisolibacter sp. H34]|uniref:RICIN domain-containing protein n=1 Tax=Huijunlia imazamoxiresistens TaxID=3127457 RepID=UPI003016CDB0
MKKNRFCFLVLLFFCFFSSFSWAQNRQNPFKPPLYWNPYEYNIRTDGYIPENEWEANIYWMRDSLKPYGYNMICIDGWGDDSKTNENGYRTTHSSNWNHDYQWWSDTLQRMGMTLGIYNNPLWINKTAADSGKLIKGTQIPISSIMNESEDSEWFKWVQVERPGAEQYVKGYIQYYADMGVKFLRVDFLSWFEDGFDKAWFSRNPPDSVGPKRPRAYYDTALRWMREACDANGMFLSLVMPHLKNDGELERKYGHMYRINEDAGKDGSWERFNNLERGIRHTWWSQYYNPFDGYTYWSQFTGKDSTILDGDFISLNTFANVEEKKSVISLNLIAGGPVSVSDRYNTIGQDLWLYQNQELLALNADRFMGKPLTNDPADDRSQVWTGQLSNGDWVIGLFNRENTARTRSIDFRTLGFNGFAANVRDLWQHADLGKMKSFTTTVPAHGCVVLKVSLDPTSGGIYRLSARHSGKALDVVETSLADGALVHQWQPFADFTSQQWRVTDAGNGAFKLENIKSAKMLDVVASATTDGAGVHQWQNVNVTSQQWSLTRLDNGYYKIENSNSGKVLDVYGASAENGAPVKQYTYTGGAHQQWKLELLVAPQPPPAMYVGGTFNNWNAAGSEMTLQNGAWKIGGVLMNPGDHDMKFANTENWSGNDWGGAQGLSGTAVSTTGGGANIHFTLTAKGYYSITFNPQTLAYAVVNERISDGIYEVKARHSGKALDVAAQSTANGALIHQWEAFSMPSQQWTLTATGDGYYTVENRNSGKVLDVAGDSLTDGTTVHQWVGYSNFPSQQWKLVDVGEGYFKIENRNSGKVLDTYGASQDNGGLVKQYTYTAVPHQQWKLEWVSAPAPVSARAATMPESMQLPSGSMGVKLYPNPASRTLTLEVPEGSGKVVLLNASGVAVYRKHITQRVHTIDVAAFPAGVYFARIQQGNKAPVVKKVLLRH